MAFVELPGNMPTAIAPKLLPDILGSRASGTPGAFFIGMHQLHDG